MKLKHYLEQNKTKKKNTLKFILSTKIQLCNDDRVTGNLYLIFDEFFQVF